ncbi:hypothetical protein ABZP36_019497 [Zizania latifolia]
MVDGRHAATAAAAAAAEGMGPARFVRHGLHLLRHLFIREISTSSRVLASQFTRPQLPAHSSATSGAEQSRYPSLFPFPSQVAALPFRLPGLPDARVHDWV